MHGGRAGEVGGELGAHPVGRAPRRRWRREWGAEAALLPCFPHGAPAGHGELFLPSGAASPPPVAAGLWSMWWVERG